MIITLILSVWCYPDLKHGSYIAKKIPSASLFKCKRNKRAASVNMKADIYIGSAGSGIFHLRPCKSHYINLF